MSKDISGVPRTARSLTDKHQPRAAKEALMNTVRKNLLRKEEMPFARSMMTPLMMLCGLIRRCVGYDGGLRVCTSDGVASGTWAK